jgi:hypothetical protein
MTDLSHEVVSSHVSRASARKGADWAGETSVETTGSQAPSRVDLANTTTEEYDHGQVDSYRDKAIRVEFPDEPPVLTPGAARVLLRILLKAHARLEAADPSQGGDAG